MIKYNEYIPNTFRMEARAKMLVEFESIHELQQVLAEHRGERFLCVGSGSNLLLRGDFDGIVLRSAMRRVLSLNEDDDYVYIDCGAGIVLDELIAQVCDMRLYGMENLSYIPGTVGASAVQNVGAYRTEAKDIITAVHTVEIATGEERIFSNEECRFGYRDSIFKGELAGQYVVTSVTYRLAKKGEGSPLQKRQEIIDTRRAKLPEVSEYGSAGSFFKNPIVDAVTASRLLSLYPDMPNYPLAPVGEREGERGLKLSAAWLIDQAGMKGQTEGGAAVWEKQPLVIVNTGNATPKDIETLAARIQQAVLSKFGVTLTPEVNYL